MPVIDFENLPDKEPVNDVVAEPSGIDFEALPDKEVSKELTSPNRLPRFKDIQSKIPVNMKDYEQDAKDAISAAATYDLDMNQAYSLQGKIKEELDQPNLWDQAQGSFKAGMGDVYVGMGNTLKWAGMDEAFSDVYVDFGERMRDAYIPAADQSEFSWRKTIDPEWWATTVTRSVPFTLSLIPAAIAGAYGGAATAGAAGLGTFGTTVMTALGSAAASRPLESAFEASAAYETALARGDSEEDASSAADKVFASNMTLLGLDAAQFAVAFTPLKFGKGLKPSLMRRMAAGAGKLSAVAISEAGEERYQEYIQMEALGEEGNFFDLDNPRLNEASTIGGIFGAGMGGAGSVWNALTKKTTEAMPEDVSKLYNDVRAQSLSGGADEAQATRDALDAVADTPEGKEHIETVLNDMKETASKEMPVEGKPEISAPTIEELFEKLKTEDLTEEELGGLLDQFAGGREIIEEVVAEPVAEIKERLLATGMSEGEATANAALFDGFRVLAQRAGVSVEDLMDRYLPEVAREGAEKVAPVITEEDRRAITDNPFLSTQITTDEQFADVARLETVRESINETLADQKEEQEVTDEEMEQMREAVTFLDEKVKTLRAGEVLEQAPVAPAPAFFSKLENVVTEKMQKKASAQDILNMIKKGDVKAEEIKWSGIEDYLKGKESVTKDEVLEFLKANQIEVTEVEKGVGETASPDDVSQQMFGVNFDVLLSHEQSDVLREIDTEDATKFSKYTLPGGENYKELLLTLPVVDEARVIYTDENVVPIEPGTEPIADDGKRFWYFRTPDNVLQILKSKYADREEAKQYVIREKQPGATPGVAFKSGHFDEPNILAHVRFNERTDAEGNKVLFLEEVQSDWALEARKKGVKGAITELPEGFRVEPDIGGFVAYNPETGLIGRIGETKQEAIDNALKKLNGVDAVPAAPFLTGNKWTELTLKRMLRYAAENGFDSVAWISGEQTAGRYDLSKQIEVLRVRRKDDGTYSVNANLVDTSELQVISDSADASDLASMVGKDLAEKILEQGDGIVNYKDEDLKIGGEWAFTLYDKVIPNFLKKYGKKWGAKVEDVELKGVVKPSREPSQADFKRWVTENGYDVNADEEWNDYESEVKNQYYEELREDITKAKPITQQSIPITDEMKEAVLGAGQPLFQPTQEGITAAGPRGKISISPEGIDVTLFKNADASTFLHETGHLYFRMMADLSTLPSATEELKTDFETLKTWLNYEEGQIKFSVDQQEQFARGFEAYLREGKAPSSALAEAFENFKQWLMRIYKSLKDLNVELTDEVRGVMDRMLADEGVEVSGEAGALEQAPLAGEVLEQAAPTKITNMRQLAKSLGGIDYNREHLKGELDKLKEDAPATKLVINKKDDGVTLDQLREAAIEAGILTEEAALDDVISALEVNLETVEAIEEDIAKEERVRRKAETRAYQTDELRKEFIELSVKARKAYREGKDYGAVKEARKLKNILARTRKIRLVRDYFNLTDADLKKISRKNPLLLSQYEFKLYIDDVRIKAAQLSENQLQKALLINMIHVKDLGRVDNYRRVLGLPPISQMTTDQVKEFAGALEPFHDGDVFLSERELETVDRTDLAGIKTWREAKGRLAAEIGVPVEELDTFKVTEWDEYKWDTALAEKNPFYKMLVTETTRKLLEAELRFHEIETELFDLARKSEKSRDRTFIEKAIPQDKQVMAYLETPFDERDVLIEAMTPEQIDFARYMEAYFEIALKYLIQTKSLNRGRQNYFVHMRRSFLENVKEDGLVAAFKDIFKAYQEDEAVFNIMDEDTGNILPLEKFFQFSLRRTGGIQPTTNVTKAFLVYAQMMEKKISLDELIPKMDIYAQSITPTTYTPRGLEVDRSIKKFVNKYINNRKGRRIRWISKQGGTIDVATRGARSLTTLIDLGLNIPSGIAAFVGEQVTNMGMLGVGGYTKGNARIKTKKGKAILKKYEAFIGRSSWENFTAPGKEVTERIYDGLFGLFHEASVLANKQFLLGAITDDEYNSGELTSERLAILKVEMGRLRVVPGTKSMVGSTSAGSAMMQYKTWAAPIISTLTRDITTLVNDLAKKKTGEALTTKEAKEIYRVIGLTTTALIVGAMASAENDDETFTGQVLKRIYRESMTLMQGVDPSLWLATPRLMGFMTQLGKNLKAIATLEEYKSKPGLVGVEGLQRQLTPRAFKQFDEPRKKERL